MADPRRAFTVVDRTTISLRLRDGWGIRKIARSLGRSPGTISDEVNRNGGSMAYEAGAAGVEAAAKRQLTGRRPRMSHDGALFTEAARLLGLGWSPEQISGRRKREEAGMERPSGVRVSHEAIYAAIYALPRGELRRELIGCLRHAKPTRGRKPKGSELRGKLVGMTNIKDRPEAIEGRLVPGHWEGDLILGAKGTSAIGTLVGNPGNVGSMNMSARFSDQPARHRSGGRRRHRILWRRRAPIGSTAETYRLKPHKPIRAKCKRLAGTSAATNNDRERKQTNDQNRP
jgi:IS30 family transposase